MVMGQEYPQMGGSKQPLCHQVAAGTVMTMVLRFRDTGGEAA